MKKAGSRNAIAGPIFVFSLMIAMLWLGVFLLTLIYHTIIVATAVGLLSSIILRLSVNSDTLSYLMAVVLGLLAGALISIVAIRLYDEIGYPIIMATGLPIAVGFGLAAAQLFASGDEVTSR